MATPAHPKVAIPHDVWIYISHFIHPWEINPFLLLRLSHISKSARSAFLRPALWKNLNPYSVENPAVHFISTWLALDPQNKAHLKHVWANITWPYTHGSYEKSDYLMLQAIRNEIPGPFQHNLYYQLGFLVATASASFREDIMPCPISDPQMLLCAIRIIPHNWNRAVPALKFNHEIIMATINTRLPEFDEIKQTYELSQKVDGVCVLCSCYYPIGEFGPELNNNKDFIRATVTANWRSMNRASNAIKHDLEFAKELLALRSQIYRLLPPPLLMNRQLVVDAVRRDKANLPYVPQPLVDRELLSVAFSDPVSPRNVEFRLNGSESLPTPQFIKYIGVLLRPYANDKQLVLQLVSWSGLFIQYASPELRSDPEVVETAIKSDGTAIELASTYVSKLEKPERIRLFMLAVQTRPDILCYVPDYRGIKELVYAATKVNGVAYLYKSANLRQDHELYKLAMQTNPIAATVAPKQFVSDEDLLKLARTHPIQAAKSGRLNTRGLVLEALKYHAIPISAIPNFINDREIALKVCERDGTQFAQLGKLKQDKEIAFAALKNNPSFFAIHPEYLNDSRFQLMYKLRVGWQAARELIGDVVMD